MNFEGKVAVVTGGASGIGRAIVEAFHARGAAVAIVDRNVEPARSLCVSLKSRAMSLEIDLSREEEIAGLAAAVTDSFGGIDILVHSAGIQRYGTALTTTPAEWNEVIANNLTSAYLVARACLPEMIRRGSGSIVLIGSVQSMMAQRNSLAYVVAKHGLLGLTRSLALDHAEAGIRVNCICPGSIDTPLLRDAVNLSPDPEAVMNACRQMHPLGRIGQPEEVASVALFLSSEGASFITGTPVLVDGGLLLPVGGMAQTPGSGKKRE